MALTELQQATSIIDRAQDILLIVPDKASPDAIASMIALYLSLTPSNSNLVDQVSPSHLPQSLQFLAGSSQVAMQPTERAEIVLDVAGPTGSAQIRQEQLQGGVRFHLSFPPGTTLAKDQLETSIRPLPYDAVVVIGASDLEELGPIFNKHVDFFYNTPIINIDHHAANEHFGTVDLVDVTAGSQAEVTHSLITARRDTAITADITTALYAGIVAGTDSFQKPSTTPRSFQVAAYLIEHEADREAVIQNLVKTKPLKLIKLIGCIYARLNHEEQVRLFWSTLEAADFQTSGASADDIPQVMHELVNNIAGFNAAFLLYQMDRPLANQPSVFTVYLLLGKGLIQRRREIQEILSATKQNGALTFDITAPTIEAAEKIAHEKIKQILP